jgi:hypothetical protein
MRAALAWLFVVGAFIGCGASGNQPSGGSNGTGGAGSTTGAGMGGGALFDGGSGSTGTGIPDGDGCGSMALQAQVTPGNIVVVFDQSDSMIQPFMAGGAPKWKVARDSLVAALTPDEGIINAGAIFFPTKATGTLCSDVATIGTPPQIKIEPGATFVSDFEAHFSAPGWTLILGTPTVTALENADAALPDPSPLKGQRAVVILTDGAPTCDTVQADILAPVKDMFSRGIKTYAIGLPGSAGAANLLDAIAMAGGTGSYISPSDPAALQMALAQIATQTIDKCTVTLNPPPPDPNQVYLVVTDAQHPKGYEVPRTMGGDGWNLSPDGKTATLTGMVCTNAKDGSYTSVHFVYGCPVLPQ